MFLELKLISKSYDKRDVLKNISLQVAEGDSVAITGASGSGKTTLLNIIGGMDFAETGSVIFNGSALDKLSRNEMAAFRNTKIGFVFQMHYLLPQCTLLENVLIPTIPLHNKSSKNATLQRALKLIERVGLTNQINQLPTELSGGECQRAALVRALINNPKMILADEPTGSLDSDSAEVLGQLLLDLNKENNTTLIVVTHSQNLAEKMNKKYYLKNGNLIKY